MAVDTLRMPTQPFSAVLVGDESLLVRCGEILIARGHHIDAIVTRSSDVRAFAQSHSIECHADPDALFGSSIADFDFLFSIANLRILPKDVVALPRRYAINFHDGPLPALAGLHTTSWAIAAGNDSHAVTWHVMDNGIDTGPIVVQRTFKIETTETAFSLNTRCYEAGRSSFEELVARIESDSIEPTEQSGPRTLYKRDHRPPHGGLLLPSMSAVEQDRLVRALFFGPYDNPIGLPRLPLRHALFVLAASRGAEGECQADVPPGTLLSLDDERAVVVTCDGCIAYERVVDIGGTEQPAGAALQALGLQVGEPIVQLDLDEIASFVAIDKAAIRNEFAGLGQIRDPLPLTGARILPTTDLLPQADGAAASKQLHAEGTRSGADLIGLSRVVGGPDAPFSVEEIGAATVAVFLGKLGDEATFDLDVVTSVADHGTSVDFTPGLPIRFSFTDRRAPLADHIRRAATQLQVAARPFVLRRDVAIRRSGAADLLSDNARAARIVLELGEAGRGVDDAALRIRITDGAVYWQPGRATDRHSDARRISDLFDEFVSTVLAAPDTPLAETSLCPVSERGAIEGEIVEDANATFLLHDAIEDGLGDDPDRVVAVWNDGELTAGGLIDAANQLASALRVRGAGPGDRVGICVERDGDILTGVLGILKSGAAYVPVDPALPLARRKQIVGDAGLRLVVCSDSLNALYGELECELINPAGEPRGDGPDPMPTTAEARSNGSPTDPAYVIYTSGSTGEPKGVVVRHENVGNFFTGMDGSIGTGAAGRWLAVTSLSFDISVLELFWSLARGFDVVIHSPMQSPSQTVTGSTRLSQRSGPIDFSLFFFSSSEDAEPGSDAYSLLMDSARFADTNGFAAVWTPERHFHAFGGLFPNPAVVGAALAAQTEHVQIRAGSCVSPLHHPVRIAEEWSVVDNLSDGRVGIAFAAGWQPHDFVLMPQNYADRKRIMYEQVTAVRALWRGEAVSFPGHDGEPVVVSTLPRPVQTELPVWITAAGNPETFRAAGEAGYNILTHLLGQSIDELAEKVAAYRAGRAAAGHDGPGYVSAMIHTFVHPDAEYAERTVREPLKTYLRSAIGLVQDAAWSFPTFKDKTIDDAGRFTLDHLSEEDVDAILDHAFERYYRSSGLFGTPDACLDTIGQLVDAGINDIACLVDFGIHADVVLGGLRHLADLQKRAQTVGRREAAGGETVSDAIQRYGVTHLQCTPSLARLILEEAGHVQALSQLQQVLVGGEILSPLLARRLRMTVRGDLYNMYGPTETTIWSTTDRVSNDGPVVPIGLPIANTKLYVVDMDQQPVPAGYAGELLIGGASVASGYLNREDETRARFFADPFASSGAVYATGDRCRVLDDGRVVFLGRSDGQVKVNGYRIELGDIEHAMESVDGITHAVAHVADQSGTAVIQAFYLTDEGVTINRTKVREALAALLPDYAIPSMIEEVESLPLTINGKIDRTRLTNLRARGGPGNGAAVRSTVGNVTVGRTAPGLQPSTSVQRQIADVLAQLLQRDSVALDDNFFDIGGHSLLAVQVIAQLSADFGHEVSLVDFFRYPTVRSLAEFLDADGTTENSQALTAGASRAQARRAAIQRRSR